MRLRALFESAENMVARLQALRGVCRSAGFFSSQETLLITSLGNASICEPEGPPHHTIPIGFLAKRLAMGLRFPLIAICAILSAGGIQAAAQTGVSIISLS